MAIVKVTQAMRDATSFGERLRALREAQRDGKGWSLEFASGEIGIAKGSLQSYEKGKFPPIDVASRIVEVYGSDLSYVWYGRLDYHERLSGPNTFRMQTRHEISRTETRLIDLKLERLQVLEQQQELAARKLAALDEEIEALEKEVGSRGRSDPGNS